MKSASCMTARSRPMPGRSLLTAGVGRSLKEAIELGRRAKDNGAGRADGAPAARPLRRAAIAGRLLQGHRRRRGRAAGRLCAVGRDEPDGHPGRRQPSQRGGRQVRDHEPDAALRVHPLQRPGDRALGVRTGRRLGRARSTRSARRASRRGSSMSIPRARWRFTPRSSRAISTACANSSPRSPGSRRCARASATEPTSRSSRKPWRLIGFPGRPRAPARPSCARRRDKREARPTSCASWGLLPSRAAAE